MSAPVHLEGDEAPAVHSLPSLPPSLPPFLHPSIPPSLPPSIPPSPLQVLWAPLGSHPSLSHTGPIIGAAHKLVGLQMGRACRTYMVSATPDKDLRVRPHRNMWSSGCGQDNVFSMFVKNKVNRVWECPCASCSWWVCGCVGQLKLREVLELVWPLGT